MNRHFRNILIDLNRPVDLQAIVGNMDEEHREWFCQRYELYCRQVSSQAEAAH